MTTKIKTNNLADRTQTAIQQTGLALMAVAATIGMLELPDHDMRSKVIVPNQPVFAYANENEEANNPVRREKEDTDSHYVSYSEVQRTPSRSGRHK